MIIISVLLLVIGIVFLAEGVDGINMYRIAGKPNHPCYHKAVKVVFSVGGGESLKTTNFFMLLISLACIACGIFGLLHS